MKREYKALPKDLRCYFYDGPRLLSGKIKSELILNDKLTQHLNLDINNVVCLVDVYDHKNNSLTQIKETFFIKRNEIYLTKSSALNKEESYFPKKSVMIEYLEKGSKCSIQNGDDDFKTVTIKDFDIIIDNSNDYSILYHFEEECIEPTIDIFYN